MCRSSLSTAMPTVQVTVEPHLSTGRWKVRFGNGIERSLSRAVALYTKSMPVSTTMFPTALSLYFAHDERKFSEQVEKRFRKSSGLRTILEGHFQVRGPAVECPMS